MTKKSEAKKTPATKPAAVPPVDPKALDEARLKTEELGEFVDDVPAERTEAAELPDEVTTDDLPPLSDEEKTNQAQLLEAQADAEARGDVKPQGVKPVRHLRAAIVNNTSMGPLMIPVPAPVNKSNPAVHAGPMLKVLAGVNSIDSEKWEKVKGERSVRHMLQSGVLVELKSNSLRMLNEKDAIVVVRQTADAPLLKEWLDQEKRQNVREQIQANLDMVKPGASKKSQAPEDEEAEEE